MPPTSENLQAPITRAQRSPRQIELDMREVLENSLTGTGGIAGLLLRRTDENTATLQAIRKFILEDVSPDIAMTDPALYRKLSRLRMEMILRGWHHYFKG